MQLSPLKFDTQQTYENWIFSKAKVNKLREGDRIDVRLKCKHYLLKTVNVISNKNDKIEVIACDNENIKEIIKLYERNSYQRFFNVGVSQYQVKHLFKVGDIINVKPILLEPKNKEWIKATIIRITFCQIKVKYFSEKNKKINKYWIHCLNKNEIELLNNDNNIDNKDNNEMKEEKKSNDFKSFELTFDDIKTRYVNCLQKKETFFVDWRDNCGRFWYVKVLAINENKKEMNIKFIDKSPNINKCVSYNKGRFCIGKSISRRYIMYLYLINQNKNIS